MNYLIFNRSYGKRRGKRASWDYVSFGQNMFFASLSYLIIRPFFYHLSNFLGFLFLTLAPNFTSLVHFYLISNNHVNASFLSNYIARRLKQGYRLRELINPLRRELKRLKKSHTSRFRKLVEKSQLAGKTLRFNYTSVFSHVLFRLFAFFKRSLSKFFIYSHTLVNYEFMFIVFSLIKSHFNIKFSSTKSSLLVKNRRKTYRVSKRILSLRRLAGICKAMINRRAQTLFFYRVTQANFYSRYVFLSIFYPQTTNIMNKPDYYFFLREVVDSFINNYSITLNSNILSLANRNISLFSIYKSFNVGFKGFIRYMRFSMLKFNLAHYFHRMKVNKKNARVQERIRNYGLIGFKFHLKGRFTRKQIAASHVFRRGPLPLSTLNINLDYSFSTVAIKNSAVGIKV